MEGDWKLVADKSGATRLGFCMMLKFFELEGRFPEPLEEVPRAAVEYVAELVKVPAADFAKYSLTRRTAEYHRAQVREALGFRPFADCSEKLVAAWRARAIKMYPSDFRDTSENVRITLLAACAPPGRRRLPMPWETR